jgi:glycosyltransferase involved in cell wall biosynthesis
MRIAQVSTLATPVRRSGTGSVEGLVWLLARELSALGHEVTTFAAAGSGACGDVVATLPGAYARNGAPDDWQLCEWINLARAVEQSARFDVIHSHAYLWGLPLGPLSHAPLLHTLHVMPQDDTARLWGMYPGARVTALSSFQWSAYPELRPAAVVPHGVDPAQFTFRPEPDDYVCFLGRFTSGKGPLQAIAAAREAGVRLVLAGPHSEYFRKHVQPRVDGRDVEYVGPLRGPERDRLLGGARALLYPLSTPEPFGLVMVEAMMCGTPVAAARIGAVPEIVEEGVTGCSAETPGQYLDAVRGALTLDRRRVRQRAEDRYSAERMARAYLELYAELAAGAEGAR